jgi:hypothetical protein
VLRGVGREDCCETANAFKEEGEKFGFGRESDGGGAVDLKRIDVALRKDGASSCRWTFLVGRSCKLGFISWFANGRTL